MEIQSSVEAYLDGSRAGRRGPYEVTRPYWGSHSEVFLLKAANGDRSVVRAFRSWRHARRYAATMERFGHSGLPLPELLWSDTSALTWLQHRRWFCAEEFVDGSLLVDAGTNDATLSALVNSLALLHSQRSRHWGRPSRPRKTDFRAGMLAQCERYLESIPATSPLLRAGDLESWRALLAVSSEKLPPITEFSLLHGKIGTDDVVISPDRKRATFIDLEGLTYGHFAHDLMTVLYEVAGVRVGEEAALVDQYLRARRDSPGDELEATLDFFGVRHHLRKLSVAHRKTDPEKLDQHFRANFHYTALVERARRI